MQNRIESKSVYFFMGRDDENVGKTIVVPIEAMDIMKKQADDLLETISDEVLIRELERRGYTVFAPLEPTDWDAPGELDDFPDFKPEDDGEIK